MEIKYGLNSKPGFWTTLFLGLQWFAVTIPAVIIIGKVLAGLFADEQELQIIYMQRLFFITGAVMIVQPLFGHKLPLISGPASVLLIGIIASSGSSASAVYTSIFAGGVVLAIISFSGIFSFIQRLFTVRVVSVILLLIAFTILPLIIQLIFSGPMSAPVLIIAVFVICFSMYRLNSALKGIWKSAVVIIGIAAASVFFKLAGYNAFTSGLHISPGSPFKNFSPALSFDPALILAFLFCFIALAINDLGSIQSLSTIPGAENMERRVARGMGVTGIANAVSGILGVIGPVNYSLSPGVIASTGCASRYTVLPAGALLLIISFFPSPVAFVSDIPSPVVGIILLYLMGAQFSAGIMMIKGSKEIISFNEGVVIGFPLLLAVIIAFIPAEAAAEFPDIIRPIAGNGFVMGVLCVLLMEHILLRRND